MSKSKQRKTQIQAEPKGIVKFFQNGRVKYNLQLYSMLTIPMLFVILFSYVPMFGVIIAFKSH